MLAQILYIGTIFPRQIGTGDTPFLTFVSFPIIQSTAFTDMESLPQRYETYSVDLDDKTGIPVTWITPVASKQHQLDAFIYRIESIMIVCDQNFSCNKISPSVIIHVDIGISLHDPFLVVDLKPQGIFHFK